MMMVMIIMVMIIAMMHLYMTSTTYSPFRYTLRYRQPSLSSGTPNHFSHALPRNSSRPKWHDESTASPLPYALSSLRPPGCRRLTDVRPRPLQLGGAAPARSTTGCSVAVLQCCTAAPCLCLVLWPGPFVFSPPTNESDHTQQVHVTGVLIVQEKSRGTHTVDPVGRSQNHGTAGTSKWKGTHTYLSDPTNYLKVSRVCTNNSGVQSTIGYKQGAITNLTVQNSVRQDDYIVDAICPPSTPKTT
jgi:hypothetical protein